MQNTQVFKGKLIIRPLEANLIRDTEFLTKMDPYVILKCEGMTKRTKTHESGGKHPFWNEVNHLIFTFLLVLLI